MDREIHEALLQLGMDPAQLDKCDRLDELLVRWSSAVRLVGFADRTARQSRYFLDAFRVLRHIEAFSPCRRIADLGSGGGTPSLPMAIASPETSFHLFESNQRKAIFLREAARELTLPNVRVHAGRYETLLPQTKLTYDAATVRGLALDLALQRAVGLYVRVGGGLYWVTSRDKAESQLWEPEWEPRPPRPVDEGDEVWLSSATRTTSVSRETSSDEH